MKTVFKAIIAGAAGMLVFGATAAFAADRSDSRASHRSSSKPSFCDVDHDHRSHASNYYDYYSPDKYFRAGAYNGSGFSISFRIGDGYDNDRNYRRDDRNYRRGDRQGRRGRVVNRQTFNTRYRARVVLTEEIVRSRRGNRRLICTVQARGPEANYVPKRRMRKIANRNCSPRARVRIYS